MQVDKTSSLNTLRPRQNGRHFPDFQRIFLNENVKISIKISLKFVPKGPINKIPALVQIMAWRRPGGKPLSEPMMVRLLTHICVTRPQWVKYGLWHVILNFFFVITSWNMLKLWFPFYKNLKIHGQSQNYFILFSLHKSVNPTFINSYTNWKVIRCIFGGPLLWQENYKFF